MLGAFVAACALLSSPVDAFNVFSSCKLRYVQASSTRVRPPFAVESWYDGGTRLAGGSTPAGLDQAQLSAIRQAARSSKFFKPLTSPGGASTDTWANVRGAFPALAGVPGEVLQEALNDVVGKPSPVISSTPAAMESSTARNDAAITGGSSSQSLLTKAKQRGFDLWNALAEPFAKAAGVAYEPSGPLQSASAYETAEITLQQFTQLLESQGDILPAEKVRTMFSAADPASKGTIEFVQCYKVILDEARRGGAGAGTGAAAERAPGAEPVEETRAIDVGMKVAGAILGPLAILSLTGPFWIASEAGDALRAGVSSAGP